MKKWLEDFAKVWAKYGWLPREAKPKGVFPNAPLAGVVGIDPGAEKPGETVVKCRVERNEGGVKASKPLYTPLGYATIEELRECVYAGFLNATRAPGEPPVKLPTPPKEKPKRWETLATTGRWVPWHHSVPPDKYRWPGPWRLDTKLAVYTNAETIEVVPRLEYLTTTIQSVNGWLVRPVVEEKPKRWEYYNGCGRAGGTWEKRNWETRTEGPKDREEGPWEWDTASCSYYMPGKPEKVFGGRVKELGLRNVNGWLVREVT